ncbi:WXG100 family type VII secretion target [Nocardia arthritidis]|uniref:WXG100 family type VII secretion target n=1 Tax=Nocardia arthritidis TaxID=228602 RepID=A0A6G9Y7B3_9NOCA|nr:hypothetical protein [Nocardia arthritidis]QIS08977.1 hypothetical protein F5544_05325 [Nocardia arthritidis]
MAGKVAVTPSQLRGAAGQMAAVRDKVDTILSDLESSLNSRGAAWGDDSYGATFAAGDNGYLVAHKNLAKGMGDVAKTLGSYADGQYKAAGLLEEQDKHHRFG